MELITDRTQADVLLGNSRGVYSHTDLNRVEQAVCALARMAEKLDLRFTPRVKLDWGEPDVFDPERWPTRGQMERYLQNVRILCTLVGVTARLPESMDRLSWEGANQIERALLAVERQIWEVENTFSYSGELFAGEE